MDTIENLLKNSSKIVFLTGAGISVSAGVPSFEDIDKNWNCPIPRYQLMSLPFFLSSGESFWKHYPKVFGNLENVKPTRFHEWLKDFEFANPSKEIFIATQNVDGLHQKAGSTKVIELHGNSRELICLPNRGKGCGKIFDLQKFLDVKTPKCPECKRILKPNLSLFYEGINGYGETQEAILNSDLLVVAGCSLNVGPVNELPFLSLARKDPKPSLWINPKSAPFGYNFGTLFLQSSDKFAETFQVG